MIGFPIFLMSRLFQAAFSFFDWLAITENITLYLNLRYGVV